MFSEGQFFLIHFEGVAVTSVDFSGSVDNIDILV
jgi:hypothetical protein